MEVERRAAVNKDQRGEEECQSVVADTEKCRGEKRFRVEHEELDGQTRQPKNSDDRANGAGEGRTGCKLLRVREGQATKRNDHEDNEAAVDPEEPAQK